MNDRIEVWLDRDILVTAANALRLVAATRRENIPLTDGNYPKEYNDNHAFDGIRELERYAQSIERSLEYRPASHGENEQISAMKKLSKDLYEEGYGQNWSDRGTVAWHLESQIKTIRRKHRDVADAFASLKEDVAVKLQALEWIAKQIPNAGNHTIKNSKAYNLIDLIGEALAAVMEIDDGESYLHHYTQEHAWTYRKLVVQNARMEARIKSMATEIENQKYADEQARKLAEIAGKSFVVRREVEVKDTMSREKNTLLVGEKSVGAAIEQGKTYLLFGGGRSCPLYMAEDSEYFEVPEPEVEDHIPF